MKAPLIAALPFLVGFLGIGPSGAFSQSQQQTLPDLVVVDNSNSLFGRFVQGDFLGGAWFAAIPSNRDWLIVQMLGTNDIIRGYGAGLYYTSSNCSGQPFTPPLGALLPFKVTALGPGKQLWVAVGQSQTVTLRSTRPVDGPCETIVDGFVAAAFPMRDTLINLNSFRPPFRIVARPD